MCLQRAGNANSKPSWTAKLLENPRLLCSKVREEADELCRALEDSEGHERVVSEAADLLYHGLVLLATQVHCNPRWPFELHRRQLEDVLQYPAYIDINIQALLATQSLHWGCRGCRQKRSSRSYGRDLAPRVLKKRQRAKLHDQ